MASHEDSDVAIEAGSDAAPLLEGAEHALDDVARIVDDTVIIVLDVDVLAVWIDGLGAALDEPFAQLLAAVAFVGNQFCILRYRLDEQPVRSLSCSCWRAEDAFPNAALGRANEPVIECFLWAIDVGAFPPTGTAAKSMDDAIQQATIIHAWLAAHVGRQQRLDACPLCIEKSKKISILPPP